jgi:hypothetical protein
MEVRFTKTKFKRPAQKPSEMSTLSQDVCIFMAKEVTANKRLFAFKCGLGLDVCLGENTFLFVVCRSVIVKNWILREVFDVKLNIRL